MDLKKFIEDELAVFTETQSMRDSFNYPQQLEYSIQEGPNGIFHGRIIQYRKNTNPPMGIEVLVYITDSDQEKLHLQILMQLVTAGIAKCREVRKQLDEGRYTHDI